MILPNQVSGQDLSSLRWKERILLITTSSPSDGFFKNQMAQLSCDESEFDERKLKILHVTPESVWSVRDNNLLAGGNSSIHQKFWRKGVSQTILIGLDGRVKLSRNTAVPCAELFANIDAMPMRLAEIRRGK